MPIGFSLVCSGKRGKRRYGISDLQSSVLISLFIQHLAMTTNQEREVAVGAGRRSDWSAVSIHHAFSLATTNHWLSSL